MDRGIPETIEISEYETGTPANRGTFVNVSIVTLGCKANQYDTSAIERTLILAGFTVVDPAGRSDAYVINTCTVTNKTDSRSRRIIRKLRRNNPDAIIVVAGCYAEVSYGEISSLDGVDYVVGNSAKDKIVECLLSGRRERALQLCNKKNLDNIGIRAAGRSERTRAYIKVQDGCNNSCSYCIIPKARGKARSLPVESVLRELSVLIEAGYKEVVITGIHLGSYGVDLTPPSSFTKLMGEIVKAGYPCRFRISSLDPDEVTEGLIEIISSSGTICKHLHLPIQSGDINIVKRMNRSNYPDKFRNKIGMMLKKIPDLSVGVDIIVGFPGEGEREFLHTYNLLEELPLSYMHIFPFSPRGGTAADKFTGRVEQEVVKKRCYHLRKLDKVKRMTFLSNFIGRHMDVLIERKKDEAGLFATGKTGNYIPVEIDNYAGEVNQLVPVYLRGMGQKCVVGSVM